ncbi:hypothetical protein B2G71_15335 [Novosphingobium sp. PC22D]|uniref:hypothetical protein n=1 Tax=Novosphingobium sp. PC22D TaxID=1962403 RepID=UPI000BFAF2A7|nr:hypothetical protein [Novosphingobium sp. PC22D]PEQ11813.1 hypothetical protein B2G71_15335 [Novosphingobium sp. PC22D]
MVRTRALALLAPLALAACLAEPPAPLPPPPAEATDPLVRASMMETVSVDGPKVTPLEVLEDSRCPMNARCVWAGRVRLKVRIDLGARSDVRELTQGNPVHVADGSLELVEVQPDRSTPAEMDIPPGHYRFGFRFMGGI